MVSPLQQERDAFSITDDQPANYALQAGRVLRHGVSGGLVVLVDGRESAPRCAASCLVAPEPGDLVLVAHGQSDDFILAVLRRPGFAPAVLAATTPSESLILAAKKLEFHATEAIEVAAPRTTIKSGRFTIAAEALSFVAKLMTQTLGRWQSSAQKIEMVATDIATKAARRVTIVDETDVLEAGTLVQKIDAASVTSAEAVVIAANEDLRLDGTRVTVG
jgi:Protein of unknown function (DUF3540)